MFSQYVLGFSETQMLTNEWIIQLEIVIRCVVASICGAIIGIERKNRLKDAGVRTHLIVALASTLMMAISKYGFFDLLRYAETSGLEIRLDPSRVASCIITGIGFLGAGTIFVRKQVINGLTTAAGLWAVAGIGMAIGAGMYAAGIIMTVVLFLAQVILHSNTRLLSSMTADIINIKAAYSTDAVKKINEIFAGMKIQVVSEKYQQNADGDIDMECVVRIPKKQTLASVGDELQKHEFIKGFDL